MSERQVTYDILDKVTADIGTPEEIQNWIERQDNRSYTVEEVKGELLKLYALGLVDIEIGFMASEKGQNLYKKLEEEDPKRFESTPKQPTATT